MFSRENYIGILLLALCAVAAVILIVAIITGDTPTVPKPLEVPLTIIGFVAIAATLWLRFSGRFRRK